MKPLFVFLFLSTSIVGFAQDFEKTLNEGIALHDQGKYRLAIQNMNVLPRLIKKLPSFITKSPIVIIF